MIPPGRAGPPVVAVGGVAVADGALLLVRRANAPQSGRWTIPGGRVERGEKLVDAVEREVREETGIEVRCGPFLGIAERIGEDFHYVILDFVVEIRGGTSQPRPGGDALDAAWVPMRSVPGVELVEGLEGFLRTHGVLG
ncbi:MAG: NUDIX domain-containing protein [Actinobacteria bacterium]|nr:NUDIX domain-containing protein [Actinomycetota bacterium]